MEEVPSVGSGGGGAPVAAGDAPAAGGAVAAEEKKEAPGAGGALGVGLGVLSGPGDGVAPAGAPGAELGWDAGGGWLAGVRRILAAMGTSSSSSSSLPGCGWSGGGDMGGDGGGGALNTPSASRSAKVRSRMRWREGRPAPSSRAGAPPPTAPPADLLDDAPRCPGRGTDALTPSSSQSGMEAMIASRCGSLQSGRTESGMVSVGSPPKSALRKIAVRPSSSARD